MAMAMAVCNSWNPFRSQNFFYAIICYYFLLVFPLHATALSFNLTNIGPQLNAEIVVEGDAYENTSGKLTDFNTYFSFVIDSIGSYDFADGITFFLVPNGSTPNITFGTYQDAWDPVNITPTTHVGIDINSLNSSAYAIWNNDITDGNSAESSISFVVDLKTMLPEWVTIGFSAATGLFFEKNNIKSWTFNSTLQSPNPNPDPNLSPSPSPSPSSNIVTHSPGKKIGKNNKKAQVMGLTVSSFVLVVGLSLLGFVLWKKSSRAKQEDEFTIELSMDNDFEAGKQFMCLILKLHCPFSLQKMLVPTYLAPPVNASSLVSLTYGSTTVSNSNQVQSSSYSYNTYSSKFSSSSASSSPTTSLLYT
ncbi:L-type lectin-domain containing receptor kinase IX.1 [Camellia lanceoleosa]|uniref:L-type lectin-domain containing receptor kinase IX.1 n=1 Tax=Camellia lanceoleosa TaxID=1840588 RepID=A0ACC0FNS3_9ERIC|nr:L-type lectin-domain containing receptor kinase IX.1 [Camellia lanceoleosa]